MRGCRDTDGEHRRGGLSTTACQRVRHKRDPHDKIGSRALVILSCSSHSIDQSCELTVSRVASFRNREGHPSSRWQDAYAGGRARTPVTLPVAHESQTTGLTP